MIDPEHEALAGVMLAAQPLSIPDLLRVTRLTDPDDAARAVNSLVARKKLVRLQLLRTGAGALETVYGTPQMATRPDDRGRLLRNVYTSDLSWESAVHEAAHAVQARSMGGFTVKLTTREQGGGSVTVALPERVKGTKPYAAIVAFHLAGAAAELEMENDGTAAASDDEASALVAAAEGGIPVPVVGLLRESVARNVRRNWPQILAVAAELYNRRKPVKGEDALNLVEQACERSSRG